MKNSFKKKEYGYLVWSGIVPSTRWCLLKSACQECIDLVSEVLLNWNLSKNPVIVEELLTTQRLGDMICMKMWSDLRKGAPMKQTHWSSLSISQDALQDRSQTWSTQHILICCVCLGDNSEDADEIIQCDNCGVTVHEGKLSDSWFFHLSPAFEGWEQFVS